MSADSVNKRLNKGDRLGKYEILEFIARGGMGTVYKGRDVQLDRIVALKVLPPSLARQAKMLDRFRREARAAARLHHDNIVSVYEFGELSGVFALVMEYVPGVDLQDYIDKRRKLAPEEARQIILQAARALEHAHEQKVVHRDIKPSNFLLTRKDGRLLVKLTDMGLALHPSDEELRLTREGTTVGTIDYMAPEQARNSGSADIRSDIYSLGCTFYHILAGTAPFARGTMAERLLQHLQDEAPDVRKLNQEVPPGYVAILQRMLAKKPEERYQSPQELLHDLEDPERAVARAAPETPPTVPRDVPAARKAPPRARSGAPVPIAAAPVADEMPALVPLESEAPPLEPEPPPPPPPASAQRPRRREPPPKTPRPEPVRETRDTRTTRDTPQRDRAAVTRDRPASDGSSAGFPAWAFLLAGGAVLALIGIIAVGLSLRGGPAPKKVDPPPGPGVVQVPNVIPIDPNAAKKDPDTPQVAGNAAQMGPAKPVLPALYDMTVPPDVAGLRREFYGPFEPPSQQPVGAPVLRVSRGAAPGPGSFRSLAEALAALPEGPAIIEIHDRGPLFIGSLPALDGHDVFLRGGPGFRPLLAWEPPRATKDQAPAVMLNQRRGLLVVENFDIVVKWTEMKPNAPACLFQVAGGRLCLHDCTISLAGSQPQGIVLTRLKRGNGDPPRVRIANCFARGIDLTAVAVEDTSADVLIDHTLLAGNAQPLVRIAGREDDDVKLRFVRSTLVTGQNCLRADRGTPAVQVLAWDTILARNDPAAPEGDLVKFGNDAEPRLKWRAVTTVYAGWKQLLASTAKSIDGSDLNAWRAYAQHRDGDRAVLETWPNNPPAQLEDLPATVFWTYETPVGFSATASNGPLGAVVGQLPPEPADWLKQTFDRPPLALAAVTDPGEPAIDNAADGLYHGERIELGPGADLGLMLARLLQGKPLAARIVFRIAGSGEHPSSPLRVQGIAELVLYFEPPAKDAKETKSTPLMLTVDPKGLAVERAALIEVERGNLELIGVQIRCENSKSALVPPYLVKVASGSLLFHRCDVRGPLGNAPVGFHSLFAVTGPAVAPLICRLHDSVLLSGRGILETTGATVNLSVRHSVVLALGDALQPERGALNCEFEGNTWALRRALLAPRTAADRSDLVTVKALANYFTDPFGTPAPQSTLLRLPEGFVARGLLAWQGRGNAFDRRLDAFAVVAGQAGPGKMALSDWLALWGRTGEQDALVVEPGVTAKTPLNPDTPALDRLALPRDVRPEPGNPAPGADLLRLGLQKKKG